MIQRLTWNSEGFCILMKWYILAETRWFQKSTSKRHVPIQRQVQTLNPRAATLIAEGMQICTLCNCAPEENRQRREPYVYLPLISGRGLNGRSTIIEKSDLSFCRKTLWRSLKRGWNSFERQEITIATCKFATVPDSSIRRCQHCTTLAWIT